MSRLTDLRDIFRNTTDAPSESEIRAQMFNAHGEDVQRLSTEHMREVRLLALSANIGGQLATNLGGLLECELATHSGGHRTIFSITVDGTTVCDWVIEPSARLIRARVFRSENQVARTLTITEGTDFAVLVKGLAGLIREEAGLSTTGPVGLRKSAS